MGEREPGCRLIEDNGNGSKRFRAGRQTIDGTLGGAPDIPVEFATPPTGGGFLQDGSGLVSMEAEHYKASVVSPDGHAWLSAGASYVGYSGTDALRALPEDTVTIGTNYASLSPRLDYQVNFALTGTHYAWVRLQGPLSSSNSLHVGLDGQEVASSGEYQRAGDGGLRMGRQDC